MLECTYYTSVFKPAIGGWRQEKVWAAVEFISPKMVKVVDARMEDADSRRQAFSATRRAQEEIGKKKRLSSVTIVR